MDGKKFHVFVVAEDNLGASIDWSAIRAEAVAASAYLSLALLDGERSNWIVRPAPTSAQIPQQVSLEGAGPATAKAASAVIDQVLEAEALVPAIGRTEIRLFGGSAIETQLHEALAGQTTISLRVFDGGRMRAARSTRAPAKAAPAKPARVTPRPAATGPSKRPSPTSKPATSTPVRVPPKPTPARQTTPVSSPPAPHSNSASAKPSATLESVRLWYRPGRRIMAAVLTAITVGLGTFIGFVWANIWGYSFPADADVIAGAISSAQSRVFGAALLLGAAVGLLGSRARWLGFAAFAAGILVGVVPAALPGFLGWPAPQPVQTFLFDAAAFWGMGTAWAPVLYLGAGIGLSAVIARTLPAPPKGVIEARARRKDSLVHFLGRRSPVDRWAINLLVLTGLTGLVPWLLGRFILEDRFVLTTGAGVFDTEAREFWPYTVPLYLGGLSVALALTAAAMLFQPWSGRKGLGLAGLAVLALSYPIGSLASSQWSHAEQATAERLVATAFPFSDRYRTCGSAEVALPDAAGKVWLWQVWTARTVGSDIGTSECNRIQIYKGWEWVKSSDLPPGQVVDYGPLFISGSSSADALFQYIRSDGQTISISLNGDQ